MERNEMNRMGITGWDGTEWMRWDKMVGIAWDEMGWDGMKWVRMRPTGHAQ